MIKEDSPRKESVETNRPIPQLAQESPNAEKKIQNKPQKLLPAWIFLVSLKRTYINRRKREIEKINKIIKSKTENIFISFTAKKACIENLNFSNTEKTGTSQTEIMCFKFLKKR